MLHEVNFQSFNERGEVHAWIYVPAAKPKGIVQVMHGFGGHSRKEWAEKVPAGHTVLKDRRYIKK